MKGKSTAALEELLGMHQSGRPVLVGTTSVEASQAFSDKLTSIGVKHEVRAAFGRASDVLGVLWMVWKSLHLFFFGY